MKIVLALVLTITLQLSADEIQRIESMLEDIIVQNTNYEKKEKEYENKIIYLENQLKIAKKRVIIKEIVKMKTQEKSVVCLTNQKLEDNNPFPQLKMKKEYQRTPSEIEFFTPKSFRVNGEAKIYDGVDSKVIDTWENKTSFTSNQKKKNWIKITGYFVNKNWQASSKEMWIKSCDVLSRTEGTRK